MTTCPPPHTPCTRDSDTVTTPTRPSQPHDHLGHHSPTSRPPSPTLLTSPWPCTPSHAQQSHGNDDNMTIAAARSPRCRRHHLRTRAHRHAHLACTLSSSPPWIATPPHAQRRCGNDDDATIATALSSRHYRDRHLAMHTHACPPRTTLCP